MDNWMIQLAALFVLTVGYAVITAPRPNGETSKLAVPVTIGLLVAIPLFRVIYELMIK